MCNTPSYVLRWGSTSVFINSGAEEETPLSRLGSHIRSPKKLVFFRSRSTAQTTATTTSKSLAYLLLNDRCDSASFTSRSGSCAGQSLPAWKRTAPRIECPCGCRSLTWPPAKSQHVAGSHRRTRGATVFSHNSLNVGKKRKAPVLVSQGVAPRGYLRPLPGNQEKTRHFLKNSRVGEKTKNKSCSRLAKEKAQTNDFFLMKMRTTATAPPIPGLS